MNREIDPKIKPLVDILNAVVYIDTFSSCEGHFDDSDHTKHKAEVRFNIWPGRKPLLNQLVDIILEDTANYDCGAIVNFYHRPYRIPDDKKLHEQYILEINPIDTFSSADEKRENVDEAIKKVVDAVTSYLS